MSLYNNYGNIDMPSDVEEAMKILEARIKPHLEKMEQTELRAFSSDCYLELANFFSEESLLKWHKDYKDGNISKSGIFNPHGHAILPTEQNEKLCDFTNSLDVLIKDMSVIEMRAFMSSLLSEMSGHMCIEILHRQMNMRKAKIQVEPL